MTRIVQWITNTSSTRFTSFANTVDMNPVNKLTIESCEFTISSWVLTVGSIRFESNIECECTSWRQTVVISSSVWRGWMFVVCEDAVCEHWIVNLIRRLIWLSTIYQLRTQSQCNLPTAWQCAVTMNYGLTELTINQSFELRLNEWLVFNWSTVIFGDYS